MFDCGQQACRRYNYIFGTAGGSCGIIMAYTMRGGVACGVGVGLAQFAQRSVCYSVGHLSDHQLPTIAVKVENGSLIDMDGKYVHDVLSPLVARSPSIHDGKYPTVVLPGFGLFEASPNFFMNAGNAAGVDMKCSTVGEQRCIPESRIIVTCTAGKLVILHRETMGAVSGVRFRYSMLCSSDQPTESSMYLVVIVAIAVDKKWRYLTIC